MRLIVTIIMSLMFVSVVAITIADSGISRSYCDEAVVLQSFDELYTTNLRIDTATGVHFVSEPALFLDFSQAPDNTYRYDIVETDIFLINITTLERMFFYSSDILANVVWSDDSQALLIWEYDAQLDENIVTSKAIDTSETRYTHRFPASRRWRRTMLSGGRYLYADLNDEDFVIREELEEGVQESRQNNERTTMMFLDTITGDLTRFNQPTSSPFVWSPDGRYVATVSRRAVGAPNVINIIDPKTGNFHPNFPKPLMGQEVAWQGDNLWFMRFNRDAGFDIWRANLTTGTINKMIENSRLDTISPNGEWAYVHDSEADDIGVVHVATGRRTMLNLTDLVLQYRFSASFSDNEQCAAILLTDLTRRHHYELWVVDLARGAVRSKHAVRGTFHDIRWD